MPSFTLYAKVLGESHLETIVFISGFVGSHEVWDKNFQSLSRKYKLVLIDTLGFGHSPKPGISYSVNDHVEAIRETLSQLGINAAHFVGYSMGALIGLAYGYHFQENTRKLVLISLPWYRDEQEARETIKKRALFNRLLAMDTPIAHLVCSIMCLLRPVLMPVMPMLVRNVPAVVAKDALRHTWTSYSRTLQNVIFRSQPEEWIGAIEHPILMFHGTQDRTAPFENVRRGVVHLPHVRLIELESGHDMIFSHSAEITAEIEKFLV